MEIIGELLKTSPGTLALVAIVLLAASLALVLKGRNGHRRPALAMLGLSASSTPEGVPQTVVNLIDERVSHVVAKDIRDLRTDVDRLDDAREEARVARGLVDMRLSNLETGQREMNAKLDRLLERM